MRLDGRTEAHSVRDAQIDADLAAEVDPYDQAWRDLMRITLNALHHIEQRDEEDPPQRTPIVCPYCGHSTLYKPEGWIVGGPLRCCNPMCESNSP